LLRIGWYLDLLLALVKRFGDFRLFNARCIPSFPGGLGGWGFSSLAGFQVGTSEFTGVKRKGVSPAQGRNDPKLLYPLLLGLDVQRPDLPVIVLLLQNQQLNGVFNPSRLCPKMSMQQASLPEAISFIESPRVPLFKIKVPNAWVREWQANLIINERIRLPSSSSSSSSSLSVRMVSWRMVSCKVSTGERTHPRRWKGGDSAQPMPRNLISHP